MSRPIKIGFLTPYSGVYPHYSSHINAGMLIGLGKDPFQQQEFQFIPEYTQMGDISHTVEAAKKLLFFNDVDILSGLISYKSVPDLIPIIEQRNKIAFFFDSGEYIPYFQQTSPAIFYSSQHLWQSQFALGYWAQKEFGSAGIMTMPVYEAGYHLISAFHKGVTAAGGNEVGMHVFPFDPANPSVLDYNKFFAEVEKLQPSFVHSIFCGKAGNDFLSAWRKTAFNKSIPLIVVENMAYEDILEDVQHLDMEIYSASQWSRKSEDLKNKEFVKKFETMAGQQANVFALLGYEAGLALKAVYPQLLKNDWGAIKILLQKESVKGPRGERNFYPLSGFSLPEIDIIKIKTSTNNIHKTVLSQGKGLKFDSKEFQEIHDQSVSGWQNPYLCI